MTDLTQEERTELAKRGYANPKFFCKFFLEEWFPRPMPWVHLGLLAILTRRCEFLLDFDETYTIDHLKKIIKHFFWREDPTNTDSPKHSIFTLTQDEDGKLSISMTLSRNTLVMMPRGISKTTIANAVNLWYIVYQDCKFPVYISETQTHASQQLTNITRQLTSNALLKAVFGDLRPEQRSGLRWSESEGFVQTVTNITVAAKGRGSQIRGLNVDAQRPDRMIWDDLEDKESVKTPEQRQKTLEWAFGDAMPALPELDPNASIVALGTLLHAEALLTVLEKDPAWTTVKLAVIDEDREPLWPEWMDLAKIEAKKQSYAVKGLLHIFYLEYFNTIRAADSAKFKAEYIRIDPIPLSEVPFRAIALDPAISKKRRADSAVIAVVGMRKNGVIQILDTWGKKGPTPRELVDKYFEMKVLWKTIRQGIENQQYQDALVHLMQEEMFRKAKQYGTDAYFEITPITHSSVEAKEARIEGILQPRFAAGYIAFQRQMPELQTQLLDWPNGKKDYPDAVAMAVKLLDDFASVASSKPLAANEMLPLEEVMGGDWRSY